jgi:monoamine oxidase
MKMNCVSSSIWIISKPGLSKT